MHRGDEPLHPGMDGAATARDSRLDAATQAAAVDAAQQGHKAATKKLMNRLQEIIVPLVGSTSSILPTLAKLGDDSSFIWSMPPPPTGQLVDRPLALGSGHRATLQSKRNASLGCCSCCGFGCSRKGRRAAGAVCARITGCTCCHTEDVIIELDQRQAILMPPEEESDKHAQHDLPLPPIMRTQHMVHSAVLLPMLCWMVPVIVLTFIILWALQYSLHRGANVCISQETLGADVNDAQLLQQFRCWQGATASVNASVAATLFTTLQAVNYVLNKSAAYTAAQFCAPVVEATAAAVAPDYAIDGRVGYVVLAAVAFLPACLVFIAFAVYVCTGTTTYHDGIDAASRPQSNPCGSSVTLARPVVLLQSIVATRAKLFMVSYKWQPESERLAEWLALNLPHCWIDKSNLANSTSLSLEIRRAAAHSRCLIILLSPAYLQSTNCMVELYTALAFRRSRASSERLHTLVFLMPGEKPQPVPKRAAQVDPTQQQQEAEKERLEEAQRKAQQWANMQRDLEGVFKDSGFGVFSDLRTMLLHIRDHVLTVTDQDDLRSTLTWFGRHVSHPNDHAIGAHQRDKLATVIPTRAMLRQPAWWQSRSKLGCPARGSVRAGRLVLQPNAASTGHYHATVGTTVRVVVAIIAHVGMLTYGITMLVQLAPVTRGHSSEVHAIVYLLRAAVACALIMLLGVLPVFVRELRAQDPRFSYTACIHSLLAAAHVTTATSAFSAGASHTATAVNAEHITVNPQHCKLACVAPQLEAPTSSSLNGVAFTVYLVHDRNNDTSVPADKSVPAALVNNVVDSVHAFLGEQGVGLHVVRTAVSEAAAISTRLFHQASAPTQHQQDRALFIVFLDTLSSAQSWLEMMASPTSRIPSHSLVLVVDTALRGAGKAFGQHAATTAAPTPQAALCNRTDVLSALFQILFTEMNDGQGGLKNSLATELMASAAMKIGPSLCKQD